MSEKVIPAGYREDVKGNLVPEKNIAPIDLARDDFVRELLPKAKALHDAMLEFKRSSMGDVGAFTDMSLERYGEQLGGRKGNVTLTSFDGSIKIQYAIQDRLAFNEGLQAAKKLIDELLHEWTTDSNPEVKAILTRAFEMDKEGNLSTTKILSLRQVKIDDKRWLKAMEAISDSLVVVESKAYIRFYERNEDGAYVHIPLDLARM